MQFNPKSNIITKSGRSKTKVKKENIFCSFLDLYYCKSAFAVC